MRVLYIESTEIYENSHHKDVNPGISFYALTHVRSYKPTKKMSNLNNNSINVEKKIDSTTSKPYGLTP